MKDTNLAREWAWSQVEAMADGTLRGGERRRMRQLMEQDPALSAAVERAIAVQRALHGRSRLSVPRELPWQLHAIVRSRVEHVHTRRSISAFAFATAAAAGVAAVAAGLLVLQPEPAAPPQTDARVAALQEFRTAMIYLQRSAAATSQGVTREIGHGFRAALETSQNAIVGERSEETNESPSGG